MQNQVAAIAFVLFMVVGAGLGYFGGVSSKTTVTSVSTSTVGSTTTLTYPIMITQTTTTTTTQISKSSLPTAPVAMMTTRNQLLLQVSLVNSTISAGRNITLHLRMTNLLTVPNSIPSNSSWAVFGPVWPGPNRCLDPLYPIGIGVSKGVHTAGNIGNATFLNLWYPGTTMCPNYSDPGAWVFQPSSDRVSSKIASRVPLDVNFTTNGYWTGYDIIGNAKYNHFGPGTYTLVAGDEWGDLLLLYFRVT